MYLYANIPPRYEEHARSELKRCLRPKDHHCAYTCDGPKKIIHKQNACIHRPLSCSISALTPCLFAHTKHNTITTRRLQPSLPRNESHPIPAATLTLLVTYRWNARPAAQLRQLGWVAVGGRNGCTLHFVFRKERVPLAPAPRCHLAATLHCVEREGAHTRIHHTYKKKQSRTVLLALGFIACRPHRHHNTPPPPDCTRLCVFFLRANNAPNPMHPHARPHTHIPCPSLSQLPLLPPDPQIDIGSSHANPLPFPMFS